MIYYKIIRQHHIFGAVNVNRITGVSKNCKVSDIIAKVRLDIQLFCIFDAKLIA